MVVKPIAKAPPECSLEGWARTLFDALDDAVFIHDHAGHIVEANAACCRRLGYPREEMLRLTTNDIDDPTFAAGFASRISQQAKSGQLRCEGRHRAKDGRYIAVDINTSIIQIDGKPAVLAIMRDITNRKRAEARQTTQLAVTRALDESGDIHRAGPLVLRYLCEGLGWDVGTLWLVDANENLLHCSHVWHNLGQTVQSFVDATRQTTFAMGHGLPGRAWNTQLSSFMPDVTAEPTFNRRDEAASAGLTAGCAFPIRSGSGTIGVIELFQRNAEKPDTALLAIMATMGSQIGQAIERQRVEKALRESEAFYHALVESLPQNIYRKDSEGRITFANHHYCKTLKKTLAELMGKSDFDLFPAHLAQKYLEDDRRVMEAGEILDAVEEHHTPSGEKLYVQIVKCPVWDSTGKAIGTQGVFWDISERTRAQKVVAESERRYRQLTEATQDGIVVADHHGRITLFNPAAERLFGYEASQVTGKKLDVFVPRDQRHKHRLAFRRFQKMRQWDLVGRPAELDGLRADGTTFPMEIAMSVIELGDGQFQLLASVRDLTERNRIRAALVQNEKLASIGLLSAGVAHEINNPLAFVANNLVVLERDSKGLLDILDLHQQLLPRLNELAPEETSNIAKLAEDIDLTYVRDNVGRLLSRTREGVDRVTRIVRSLRGLARTDAPKRQETDLPTIVDSSLEILRGRLKRHGVEAITNYDPNSTVMGVQTQLSQVLLNLMVNAQQAVEATGRSEGGKITITTKRLDDDMLIEVGDNGTGIDPANLPKLFDPFFTTKEVGEGTGLGLSIAHNIIRAHGGRIEVDSQLGVGTTFRIYLPLHTPRDVA
jgi:PAS domain S-box-containing protein